MLANRETKRFFLEKCQPRSLQGTTVGKKKEVDGKNALLLPLREFAQFYKTPINRRLNANSGRQRRHSAHLDFMRLEEDDGEIDSPPTSVTREDSANPVKF